MLSTSSWTAAMQEGCLFLQRHPAVLLPLLAFLYLFRCVTRKDSGLFVDWPIVRMLPTLIGNKNHLLDHLTSMLRASDKTLMFRGPWFGGMDFLLTCNPDNVNHMFNLHFANYPKGDEFLEIFDVLGDGIFNVDGDSWVDQRRMAHAHMSTRRFRSSVEKTTRDKMEKVLLPLLNDFAESDKVVDLSEVLMRFTWDTTCALVLGVDLGCLAPEFPRIPFAKAMDHVEQVLLFRHIVPMAWWKLLRWLRVGEEKKMAEAMEVVDHFIEQHIRERRERERRERQKTDHKANEEGSPDMMSAYVDVCDDKFLRDTLFTFLGAGKDTTGAALVWLFWLVANHPDVERKILEELWQLQPATKHPANMTVFDIEETDALVYLHAVVCETLRLYPSVPFNHKEALKTDVLPSGHKVRPGMKIITAMYSMGRMEGVWGKDCLEFKPERWITEKGTIRHEPSYKFIAFHSGPRACLGKNMAFTQIKLLAAAVIYNFHVQVVDGHVAEPKVSIVIKMKNGLMVRLKKRKARDIDG